MIQLVPLNEFSSPFLIACDDAFHWKAVIACYNHAILLIIYTCIYLTLKDSHVLNRYNGCHCYILFWLSAYLAIACYIEHTPILVIMLYMYNTPTMLCCFTGKFQRYPPRSLTRIIPRVTTIKHAADLASKLLQLVPEKRITAADALRHPYFSDLPEAVHLLKPSKYQPS